MKKIFLACSLPLLLNGMVHAQALLQIGQPSTPDLAYDLLFAQDGGFIVCGSKAKNAVVYKAGCNGSLTAQIEKPYAPGPGRFYDSVQWSDGSIASVGSATIAIAGDTIERVLILKTNADLSEIAVANFLVLNSASRAKSVTLAQNGDLIVLGEVTNLSQGIQNLFLQRVDPNTLQPIGDPVIYNDGLDVGEEIIRTADNNLLIIASSFQGNIFDPNAVITNRMHAFKVNEAGVGIWLYTYQDSFPAQQGLALFGGVEQNPVSGNFMLAGATYGGTPDLGKDAIFILLDNNGNLLDTALLQTPGRQGIYGMTAYSEIPGLFLAVGDSENAAFGTPNLFVAQAAEINGTIFQANFTNDQANPYALTDVFEIGQNRLGILASLPDNPVDLSLKDIVIATPQVTDIAILYQNCALVASFNAPNPTYQWYLNYVPIPGATAGVYFPKETGLYQVQITDNIGCYGFSDTLTVTLATAGFDFNPDNLTVEFASTSVGATAYTWDFGDGSPLVTGTVNPTHTYGADGVYTVTLIASGNCGSDTISQTIGLVAAGEPSWLRECSLFPNPNGGAFTVAITGASQPELYLSLFNQTGQMLVRHTFDFRSGTLRQALDFGAIQPGVYALQIQGQGETKYLKVVVSR